MEEVKISAKTIEFAEKATDRELQNEMYFTLRKILVKQTETATAAKITAGVAIFYVFWALIIVGLYFISP